MFLLPHFLNAEKCSPENARQYLRVFSPPLTVQAAYGCGLICFFYLTR
jgi:hypothetical protein